MFNRAIRSGLPLMLITLLALATLACGGEPLTGRSEGGASGGVAPQPPSDASSAKSNAAAPASSGAPSGGGAALPSTDTNRLLIRTGSVDLIVKSVTETTEATRKAATAAGGFVSDSTIGGSGRDQSATLTLRIPANRLDEVVTQLQSLAIEVRTATTNTRDVTEELTDIDATLRNLRAVEAQYQTLLTRSGTIPEVLQVQERLNQTRLQIDRTEARRRVLGSQVEMSTLTVTLLPEPGAAIERPSQASRLTRIGQAWRESLLMLDAIITGTAVMLTYLWWVLLGGGLLVWALYRLGSRLGERHPAPASSIEQPERPAS